MEQMYAGGFTSEMYSKIVMPIKMDGVKTSIDSWETIISPLEAKTVLAAKIGMGGISQGDENWWIRRKSDPDHWALDIKNSEKWA